jgi:hypothetical protein
MMKSTIRFCIDLLSVERRMPWCSPAASRPVESDGGRSIHARHLGRHIKRPPAAGELIGDGLVGIAIDHHSPAFEFSISSGPGAGCPPGTRAGAGVIAQQAIRARGRLLEAQAMGGRGGTAMAAAAARGAKFDPVRRARKAGDAGALAATTAFTRKLCGLPGISSRRRQHTCDPRRWAPGAERSRRPAGSVAQRTGVTPGVAFTTEAVMTNLTCCPGTAVAWIAATFTRAAVERIRTRVTVFETLFA